MHFEMRALALAALLIGLASFGLQWAAPLWVDWAPASCLPTACFCEARHAHGYAQPANTWSSFAYLVAGSALVFRVAAHQRWLGICAFMIGLGSAFYHASLTFTGQFFDVFGMVLLAGFMLVFAARNSGRQWAGGGMQRAYVLLITTLSLALWFAPETRRWVFALVLGTALLAEWTHQRGRQPAIDTRWFWLGLLLFAIAYVIWTIDNTRLWCNPASWLQGHAIWHVLCALSTLCLARYYQSESRGSAPAIPT